MRARRQVHGRALLAALVLIVGSPPGGPAAQEGFIARVAEVPETCRDLELDRRAYELVREPAALETYLTLMAAGGWRQADGSWRSPGPVQVHLLERTAALFPPTTVVPVVRNGLVSRPEAPWRRIALDLLGRHASSIYLALLAEVATDPRSGRPWPELVEPFAEALTEVLRREGVRPHELSWLVEAAEPLTGAVVRAVGRAGDPAGLTWLAARLEDPTLVSAAVQEIGRLASAGRGDRPAFVADAVHPLLQSGDEPLQRAAIRALGALGQPSSIARLVALLEHAPSTGEQRMIVAALQSISGVPLPADPAGWRQWYERERRWRDEEGAAAVARLDLEDPAAIVAAVQELAGHPLFRDQLAPPLVVLLRRHESLSVRAQVCLALGRLRTDEGLAALEEALEDDAPEVRGTAARALERLRTGP
jgi:HEAT repeat protein